MPVFPEVPSTIVYPGLSLPSFSASSIILSAIRSLIELPGLKYSTFARTKASISFVNEFNFIKGVFPIVSNIFLIYFIAICKCNDIDPQYIFSNYFILIDSEGDILLIINEGIINIVKQNNNTEIFKINKVIKLKSNGSSET